MGLAYSSVLSFLSSYVKVIDLVDVSTFFFIVYAVVITLTRPSTGRIFDVKGERYVMYPSYIFLTLGLFLLSMTTSGLDVISLRWVNWLRLWYFHVKWPSGLSSRKPKSSPYRDCFIDLFHRFRPWIRGWSVRFR